MLLPHPDLTIYVPLQVFYSSSVSAAYHTSSLDGRCLLSSAAHVKTGLPIFERTSRAQPTLRTLQVFEQAGLKSPILGSIVIGLVNVSGTVVAALIMDRFGRKPLLLLSHFGMAVSLASISVAVHFICEWGL